jgi:acetyltransferase-like isoleucine patch superfamily enzyme
LARWAKRSPSTPAQKLQDVSRARSALSRSTKQPVERANRRDDRLILGRGSYASDPDVVVGLGDPGHKVVVGNYTSIAAEATFLVGGEHHPEWVSTFPFRIAYGLPGKCEDGQPGSRGPIRLGHDVWLGRGVTILSGVTIGDGAVVGARSLVVKDVDPYTVVGGVPARTIRKRFADHHVEALLAIRWWDWPEEEILGITDILCSQDIEALLTYAEQRGLRTP